MNRAYLRLLFSACFEPFDGLVKKFRFGQNRPKNRHRLIVSNGVLVHVYQDMVRYNRYPIAMSHKSLIHKGYMR